MGINGSSPNYPSALFASLVEKAGNHHPVKDVHTDAFSFFVDLYLNIPSPDADNMFTLVIVGEHESGLFIAEIGSFELVAYIPDLYAHLLAFEEGIPALLGDDVADITAGPALHTVVASQGVILRGDFGARIGNSAMPVVNPGAACTTSFSVTSFGNGNFNTLLHGIDGCLESGDTATDNQDIRYDLINLVVVHGIGPFRELAGCLYIFVPGTHSVTSCCLSRVK